LGGKKKMTKDVLLWTFKEWVCVYDVSNSDIEYILQQQLIENMVMPNEFK